MNDIETYIANQIRLNVWSGLNVPDDVQDMITDILEVDADEEMLRGLVAEEFARKAEAEKSWPDLTDCDRLDTAFQQLNQKGVIAIHNAGWDKGEGFHNCLEAYGDAGSPKELFGICYYTSQDIESAIDGAGLFIGFSSTRPEDEATDAPRAAELICTEIRAAGLSVDWDGSASSRITVNMQWQLRSGLD
jgi:hypothetical protein